MTQRNDGGAAFPTKEFGELYHTGMSLRDYFAAKAMAALVASNDEGAGDRITDIPEYAYTIADAMLAERSK